MNKLIIKKSCIIINDYSFGSSQKLERNFTIYDPLYHTLFYKGLYYDENNRRLYLPRGIDVSYLESLFETTAVFDDRCDPFDNISPVMIKYLPKDERQEETLRFMLGESVRYNANKYRSQLAVNLPTGAGKTYCTIATSSMELVRTAILTSSIEWLEQWKKCILEYTDTKPREIFFLSGSSTINSLLRKDMSQYKYILISVATLKAYGDKNGWDKVTELFKHMRIGTKAYDEAHLSFDTMCMIDFFTSTRKTYYISATLQRSNREENEIFQLYFKNIPSIDLFDEDEDPHTHYIAIKYNSEPTPMDISNCKNGYGLDRNKYTNYVVNKPNFHMMVDIIIDMAMHKQGKCLIFIGTQMSIDSVFEYINENFPFLRGNVGIFTSKTDGDKKYELTHKIILSTTKSCGAAVDIKDLIMTVVLAEPFKSEVIAKQSLGRTRADNTFYIEIVDTGFKKVAQYYYDKKPIFAKYALDCSEIRLLKDNLYNYHYEMQERQRNLPMAIHFFPDHIGLREGISFNNERQLVKAISFD